MGEITYYIDTENSFTALIRNRYLEALERDQKVGIQQLIANFIEEYLNKTSKAPLK